MLWPCSSWAQKLRSPSVRHRPEDCTQGRDGDVVPDKWFKGIEHECIWLGGVGGRWRPRQKQPQSYITTGITYSVSGIGTVRNYAILTSDAGGASTNLGASNVSSETYPGVFAGGVWLLQPAGELRARAVIQVWNGSSWGTCRDTGWVYNSSSRDLMDVGYNMGTVPDCAQGASYRVQGYGSMFQGGAWRGASLFTPAVVLP